PISFGVNLRIAGHLDYEKLFAAMQKAHFTFINIGLESGSERVRREILNRNYSNDDIISTVKLARKYGLKVILFNMIGLPGETPQDFQETIRVNRICQPDKHFTGIFTPYPGTRLHALCQEKGFLKNTANNNMERRKAVYDFPGFSRRKIQKSYFWFDYHVYKGYLPLPKILIKVAVLHLQANPYLNVAFRKLVRLPFLKQIRISFIK
ncbi:MAG TPA: radical SAM protein, partial [Candidatus Bathyarchaeia archaeon]|nr:radical SAM protein [Candidatus Bathyarchaeia archaeon]